MALANWSEMSVGNLLSFIACYEGFRDGQLKKLLSSIYFDMDSF